MNRPRPLHICYLLASAELCGGVRVVFDQARALAQRGHRVSLRAAAGSHAWYPHALAVDYLEDLSAPFPPGDEPDILVATFWTTVAPALRLGIPRCFHFCQGYEGDMVEYEPILPQIEAAYAYPIPKLTVGPWLAHRLAQLPGAEGFDIHSIGQIVDTARFRPSAWGRLGGLRRKLQAGPIRILVVGMYEARVKGISHALHAVRLLRAGGHDIELIRVSTLPQHPDEVAITRIDQYHQAVAPAEMARLYRHADLLLAPSLPGEGFGLPLAEAMASGTPCVATAIPSFLGFDARQDYACFVPPADAQAMADGVAGLIADPAGQDRLRKRGPAVIRAHFDGRAVVDNLEKLWRQAV